MSTLWHSMTEPREEGRNVLFDDPLGYYQAALRKSHGKIEPQNKDRFKRWCYVDDILAICEPPLTEEYDESPYVADKTQESYENYGQGIDHDLYMRIFLDGVKTGYAQLSMEIDKELEKRKKN